VVPVHLHGDNLQRDTYGKKSLEFSRFTLANLRNATAQPSKGDRPANLPNIFWLHLVLAFVFVGYSLFLIHFHYEVSAFAAMLP
jgi:hypothetical protein